MVLGDESGKIIVTYIVTSLHMKFAKSRKSFHSYNNLREAEKAVHAYALSSRDQYSFKTVSRTADQRHAALNLQRSNKKIQSTFCLVKF